MIDENANTADLTINEKLDRILAELSNMNEDTGDIVMRLDRIESRLEALAIDVAEVRAAQQRTDEPGDATQ
jgi:predicted  nucleic acid-binding Zn-ribbon protein